VAFIFIDVSLSRRTERLRIMWLIALVVALLLFIYLIFMLIKEKE